MSDELMPYDGAPCGCVMCADADATLFFKGEAYCLTCWQAAEIARLRAKVEAADKLAGLAKNVDPFWHPEIAAALSAYEEAGK